MGKLTKGFLLGAASVLGAYYYKNPEEAKKHKELVLENAKKLLDKVNNTQETTDETAELEAAVEEVVEVSEENGIKLQAKEDAVEELKEDGKLDSLLSAFEPKEEVAEEEVVSPKAEEKTSKAGLVAGAGVLGGAAVAGTVLASKEAKAEEVEETPLEKTEEKVEALEKTVEPSEVEKITEEEVVTSPKAEEKTTNAGFVAGTGTATVLAVRETKTAEAPLEKAEETVELSEVGTATEEVTSPKAEEKTSKAGLVAGAGVLGGATVLAVKETKAVEAPLEKAEEKVEVLEETVEPSEVERVTEEPVTELKEDEKLDSLLSAFEPKEEVTEEEVEVSPKAEEKTSKAGLVAGAGVLGGAVAGTVLADDEAKAEETPLVTEESVTEVEELAVEDELVVDTEELTTEEYTLEDEDELARLDREIAELEAQIRAEQGESEVVHSFDLSEATVTEADLAEETTEFTYEEATLTPEEELVEKSVEEEAGNSIFGRIKSLVSGEKDAQSAVEEVSSLKDDVTNMSTEDLKAELGESTGIVRGPLDEIKSQVEDKVTGAKDEVLSRVNLQQEEGATLLDTLKSEAETVATEEVEEKKKGFFGSLGSLFTSKK